MRACWETWSRRTDFGTYNITNPGFITTREVVEMIERELKINREFSFFESEQEFMTFAAKTPSLNCIMDSSKLLRTGIQMSEVHTAVTQALKTMGCVTKTFP